MKIRIHFDYTWADADEEGNLGTSTIQFSTRVSVTALPRPGDVIHFFPHDETEGRIRVYHGTVKEVCWIPTFSQNQELPTLEPVVVLEDIKDDSVNYEKNGFIRRVLLEKGLDPKYNPYTEVISEIEAQGQKGGLQFRRCNSNQA